MRQVSGIDYRLDCEGVTAKALEELFCCAGLEGRAGEKILRAFKNSAVVRFAVAGDRLIGACRAITDGEYHAAVYDVAVDPEYQGRAIGKALMAGVLSELRVWRVMLVADPHVQGFYRQFGFGPRENVLAKCDRQWLFGSWAPSRPVEGVARTPENSSNPDGGSGPMTPPDALVAELKGLEEELLVPAVRKSTRLAELLDDEFIEFGSSGHIYTKSDLVAVLQAESPVAQTTSNFEVTFLAPDVALLTYRIRRHSEPSVQTLRSSVWRRTNGPWRMVFHQATITPTA
jgi:GNAT superfamily N-acetyltransferase